MIISAKRPKNITLEQIDAIFAHKFRQTLRSDRASVNEVTYTPNVTVIVEHKTCLIHVYINETSRKHSGSVVFSNEFFNNQLRGMIMAKAGKSDWTNAKLKEHFSQGLKIELGKALNNFGWCK